MLLFIVHPYTNNIGHIIIDRFYFGEWYLKFLISIILLQIILLIKSKFENKMLQEKQKFHTTLNEKKHDYELKLNVENMCGVILLNRNDYLQKVL